MESSWAISDPKRWCCESAALYQQILKTQQWAQDWKKSVFTGIPKKGNAKECSHYCTIALISHASKVMRVLIALVGRSEAPKLQKEIKLQVADVFIIFSSYPVLHGDTWSTWTLFQTLC